MGLEPMIKRELRKLIANFLARMAALQPLPSRLAHYAVAISRWGTLAWLWFFILFFYYFLRFNWCSAVIGLIFYFIGICPLGILLLFLLR